MKKTIRVTIEKEYEIELAPEVLTQEFVDEFESYMFELDGNDLEEKQESLFKFAATQAQYNPTFIEGLGKAENCFGGRQANVIYKQTEEWIDTEVV